MVGVFGLGAVTASNGLAFVLGLILGVLIGIIVPVEYRLWRKAKTRRSHQLKNRILRPLYNELSDAAEGDLPQDERGYQSHWQTLDSHQQRQVEEPLRNELAEYSKKLKRVNSLDAELSEINQIRKSLPYGMIETQVTETGSTTLFTTPSGAPEAVQLPIDEFLVEYGSLVTNSMSPEEMHRELAGTDLKPFVAAWDDEYPDWEESFWNAFNEDRDGLVDTAKERKYLLQTGIPEHAGRIRDMLEDRLDARQSTLL